MNPILFHTMSTPELPPVEAAGMARQLGFSGLELICDEGYLCGIAPSSSTGDAEELKQALAAAGSQVVVLSAYEKAFADADRAERDACLRRFSHTLALAGALGASAVRVLAGREVADDEWPRALERVAASLQSVADIAGEHGITLLIENHMGTMATSARRTVEICEAVGRENLRILFDPANLAFMEAEDFLSAYRLQRSRIGLVHVKDAIGQGSRRRSVVPGEGNDPWEALLSAMTSDGYAGPLSIEYERRWIADLPPANRALPRALSFVSGCFGG